MSDVSKHIRTDKHVKAKQRHGTVSVNTKNSDSTIDTIRPGPSGSVTISGTTTTSTSTSTTDQGLNCQKISGGLTSAYSLSFLLHTGDSASLTTGG
jgi:hypothetical protein